MEIGGQPVFLYILAAMSAVGGFLFGYDTGVVSGAMLMVDHDLLGTLDDITRELWHEIIVTGTIVTAAIFSIVSGFISQRFGRKPAMLIGSLLFTAGAVVMAVANSKEILLVGRLIVGAGLGFASATVPLYIAEVSPEEIRGRLTTFNQIMITFGIFCSNIIDGLFAEVDQGWKYDFGIGGIPSILLLIGFFFCPESPRWLVKGGRVDEARVILKKIRAKGFDTEQELQEIVQVCREEEKYQSGNSESMMLRILKSGYVMKALMVGCFMQLFQQLGGINTVMYYSATIIQTTGISSSQATVIWITAAVSAVNVISTLPGMYLIERWGRRMLTLISMIGIILSLVLLAVGFHLVRENSPALQSSDGSLEPCSLQTTCTGCVDLGECGFCYKDVGNGTLLGYCEPVTLEDPDTSSQGYCSSTSSDYTWLKDQCPSDYGGLIIFALCLYLLCFASGMGPTPWTVNAEIYPLWCRSWAISIATFVNWCANILVSQTYLTLNRELHQNFGESKEIIECRPYKF
ncbi:proton myo-inositol cotransporter [Eurytemora carolleeae]|uniref:proton myo-inositol cotransporter n=1 Tax=Eurytemora carolleeae TaxID=1294199 RepID=UPI000C76BD34|nr:proton myo-inositol cotransporter [Eurytemora carolleeae]|eukprot:XP_023343582.1 proton myo-inositol cotransporter-like [Eurytemora affinis]